MSPPSIAPAPAPLPNDNSFSVAYKKLSRKSHRKSRNGCHTCKGRKIKCDEQKPQCANCSRHSVHCVYPHTIAVSVSSPEPIVSASPSVHPSVSPPTHNNTVTSILAPIPQTLTSSMLRNGRNDRELARQPLNVTDLELLHHFNISTSYTLANDSGLQACFRINVPQIGFSHPFVLDGILALASLHLSRFKRAEKRAYYVSEAQHHYESALRVASTLMPNVNEETCPALYIFAVFCCHITLGLGPRPGDFLLFGEEGLAEWLVMFRGMKSVVASCRDSLRTSDLAPMFQIQNRTVEQPPSNNEHLQALREMILSSAAEDPDLQIYLSALDGLARSFPTSTPLHEMRLAQPSPQVVFAWLYRISDEFVATLQQRRPISLVILAHFCVLFNSLSSFWWTKDWVDHLMREIYGSLQKEYRLWMKWPMEEIGWVPS
ncbi:hypothetical protein HYALB_00002049 [Hymenoscyphus albidus]|uniref:Zn(2)-C6 fungal-type domain-containing protein n=1 Tax=Hymenoscyphus albidus TaxID=595503 RepID=A0A9N9LA90_9HELO|nr:hypothetical protein HYALB_00002049 [Hymenoscyphus albidus]